MLMSSESSLEVRMLAVEILLELQLYPGICYADTITLELWNNYGFHRNKTGAWSLSQHLIRWYYQMCTLI
jgi:hypothetical protein